jgi:threonine/homoserine/homoserine lactone efflux protein
MLEYLLFGGGLAFAAVIQPGPLQAFLLARTVSAGWRRTLPAALAPLLSDGPIALVVLILLGRLPVTGQQMLRACGGVLLLYLAWSCVRQLRLPSAAAEQNRDSAPRTLLQATLVNLLNPNPYLAWALVLGPAVVTAWRHDRANAVALVGAFYGTIVAGLAIFIVVAGSARLLSPRLQRTLVAVSAAILAALGVYQLVVSARALTGR